MMDEMWSRGWSEAHKAALQARETLAREGKPVPTLWDDLRMLMRVLITPPQPPQREAPRCDGEPCQSAA